MPGAFDVVVVDFPFVEQPQSRKRPALVVSRDRFNSETGTAIVAMITREGAAPRRGDVLLGDVITAGLNKPSKVRMKLHTVETGNLRIVGSLAMPDRTAVQTALREVLVQ